MIKSLRYFNNQIMAILAVSLLVMITLGSYLYVSLAKHIGQIAEMRIESRAEAAADYYEREVWTEMRTLEHIGVLLKDSDPEQWDENLEHAKELIESIFQSEPSILLGIMDVDGNAYYGEKIPMNEYKGFLVTLTGGSDISYLKTGAVLLSSSVLNGDNVHYAIYAVCSSSYIRKYHNLNNIKDLGNLSLMTNDGDMVLKFTEKEEGDEAFFYSRSVQDVFKRLRKNQITDAVAIEKVNTTRGEMLFYTAEVENTPFILAGGIPYEDAVGDLYTLMWSIMSVFCLFGVMAVVLGVLLIISSVKVRESDELRTAKKVAEDASNAKGLFLANMSHEIRTPINAILGMDEMIIRQTNDRKLVQYAYSIKSSATSLMALVNDILDFSRVEAGKLRLIEDKYHVSTMLTDMIIIIKDRAESKGLSFEVNVNKDMPEQLIGDGTRMKQVIINLLTNAVKYTNKGFVKLELDFIKINDEEIDFSVSVKDSGIGMKKEDIDKIFLAFERFDEKKNSSVEGTGLGMSIAKQILDAMGSNININSVYGVGSVFSFVVRQKVSSWEPVGDYENTAEKAEAELKGYKPSFYAPDVRILTVDDMEINLRVVKGLLEQTGILIDTALGGKEALDLIAKNKYDLMLIDHRMPGMDGIELLNRIRGDNNNQNKDCICIALTANVREGVREMYIKVGFNDYLEKPVSGTVLEEMLMQYLPKDKLRDSEERPVNEKPEEVIAIEDESSVSPEVHEEINKLQETGIVDINAGIEYAGDEDLYAETLRFFRDTIDEKADEIESLYFAENIEDYTIKVHALKSSSRLIGASGLSEKAKLLEEAGKNNDLEYIRNNTSDVLYEYRGLKELLGKI
ncbi:response regulator [Butyrivibrio sp. AE3004]|uniref:response regulator n=1 Tax=Butyrivibrio sp. AE3004 TaxID=1506994 RepID=UPI00068E04E0|nr:response regulator [Butyrivibrio sp. AE3004]